jgi:Na+-driven multidrug efflux pump
MQGIVLLSTTTLNVLHKPWHADALVIVQMFVLYIPLAYLGSHLLGLSGIFGAAAVATVAAGLLSRWWVRRVINLIGGALRSEPYM